MDVKALVGEPKKHRASKTGVKARKKDDTKKKKLGLSTDRHNPHAFSVANIVRTKKNVQRNLDRAQKKELVPLEDKTEELPPPYLVVVMGPPMCGKSSLIRSLVKLYTSQNIGEICGPITVVAGKNRRFTFFECPMDIYSMTDLAKIADLVLLMIDTSYGFEMETFEFLNILQLHGFPKVVGVLTHMDKFKLNKTLQKTKKRLKDRFWTEIYKGAKLFELTGIVNNKYLKHEIKRLSMHIMNIKFRPLVWRNTHPYMLVDRMEDVTASSLVFQSPDCDRDIATYGFIRGTHLKPNMTVHIIGVGDYPIHSVTAIEDPCPMPSQRLDRAGQSLNSLRHGKENLLYAPFSNVGRVKMDREGGLFIELKDVHYTKSDLLDVGSQGQGGGDREGERERLSTGAERLLRRMQDVPMGVDQRMQGTELSLFEGDVAVRSSDMRRVVDQDLAESGEDDDDEGDSASDSDSDDDSGSDGSRSESGGEDSDDFDDNYDDEGDDVEGEAGGGVRWKQGMKARALDNFVGRAAGESVSMMELVYGANWATSGVQMQSSGDNEKESKGKGNGKGGGQGGGGAGKGGDESDSDEDFFSLKRPSLDQEYVRLNAVDSCKPFRGDSTSTTTTTTTVAGGGGNVSGKLSELLSKLEKRNRGSKLSLSSLNLSVEENNTYVGLKNRFVTGDWSASAGKSQRGEAMSVDGASEDGSGAEGGGFGDDDEEVFGDFEDLETGEKFGASGTTSDSEGDEDEDEDDNDNDNDDNDGEGGGEGDGYDSSDQEEDNAAIDEQLREINASKKANAMSKIGVRDDDKTRSSKSKPALHDNEEQFDETAHVKEQRKAVEDRRARYREEFAGDGPHARLQHEGVRQGVYVRLIVRGVPAEFTRSFAAQLPLVIGGLMPQESEMGVITARVKKHRWHKRILKSNDVLTFSVGWRRYQTIPIYTMECEENGRRRYLKYTPEHMHCTCAFYGPLVPPNTGILAIQKASRNIADFRIAMTGTVLELDASSSVVKKLKLVGTPVKIFKNTAFIHGMFNSAIEVAKFEGTKIKTVSGIRGQIKKAVNDGEPGKFRATFEDKILMSDIVSCRVWVPVEVQKFYNPVMSLLHTTSAADGVSSAWQGMRSIAEIRKSQQIPIPVNKDSLYKPVARQPIEFRKMVVPKKLQEALPFASKPKQQSKMNRQSYTAKRQVVVDPEDRKKRAAIQMLSTIRADKDLKRHDRQKERKDAKQKEVELSQRKFESVHKDEKRKRYRDDGKDRVRAETKKSRR